MVGGSLSSGRYFSPVDERFPTAVLGFQASTRLGIGTIHAGESPPQIRIGAAWFTVIGVLRAVRLADDLDQAVLTGWHAARLSPTRALAST
ncbi:ABC transporter permease [Streptomyces violaceorubidus]|uniref:ABC transporter permease n=1 Tax=Streptomyces violaceorubidus TaxID=284042 RepID=A0ABV1T355_9ACTN